MFNSFNNVLRASTFALASMLALPTVALAAPADETTEQVAPVTGLEGQVNINTASAAELELLPGIGPSMAAKIVSYRAEHKFEQTNHLMRIKGIGKKTYARIKPFVKLEGESNLRVSK